MEKPFVNVIYKIHIYNGDFITSKAVIVPTRRATAEAMQILSQHLFGDASSPFIIGAVSLVIFQFTQIFVARCQMCRESNFQLELIMALTPQQ